MADRPHSVQLRHTLRQSYGCDCAGEEVRGLVQPSRVAGVLDTVEAWTGYRPQACPWRAFYQPIVRETLHAYRFFEAGQMAWAIPDPSAKLVEAVGHYHHAIGACRAKRMEQEREARANG